jgi:ParB-like chromosome segregation protein Spo0J
MGRYFKAQNVELNRDFIYQPPIELMAKVIQGKDLAVDKYNEYQASIDEKLKAEGLKADEPRLREIINNYHSQIDELAKTVQADPLAASKQMGAIKNLGRDIGDNWSQGEVAKIQGNKQLRDKYVEELSKRKDVSEEWKTKALQKFDKEFTGTAYDKSGKYNPYNYENLNSKFDINEFLNKNLNGFEANGKKYSKDTVSGQWIKSDGNSKEEVTFDELYKTGKQLLNSNQEAKDYYEQSQRLGFLTLEDAGYEVENALTGYANKYSYKKEGEEHSIKENPYYKWNVERNEARLEKAKELGGLQLETNARTIEQLDIINQDFSKNLNDFMKNDLKLKPLEDKKRSSKEKKVYSFTPEQGRKEIKRLKTITKDPKILSILDKKLEKLNAISSMYRDKASNVSWNGAAAIVGVPAALQIKKDYETRYGSDPESMFSIKMNEFNINGKKYKNISYNDIIKNPEKYGLPEEMFYEVSGIGKNKKRELIPGLRADYNANSNIPAVYSATDMSVNDMLFDFNKGGNSIQAKADFNRMGLSIQ